MSFLLKEEKTEKFSISFIWIKEAEKMFTWLKTAFMTVFILVYYNLKLSIQIETDALRAAVLKALLQLKKNAWDQIHWHSVAFWFCKMMSAKCNYNTENAEMLAIVMTFKHWQHYMKEIKHVITVIINYANL